MDVKLLPLLAGVAAPEADEPDLCLFKVADVSLVSRPCDNPRTALHSIANPKNTHNQDPQPDMMELQDVRVGSSR